jgi:hypothetical protein
MLPTTEVAARSLQARRNEGRVNFRQFDEKCGGEIADQVRRDRDMHARVADSLGFACASAAEGST